MAIKTMTPDGAQHYHADTVLAGATSDPVILPDVPNHRHIAFFVYPGASGSARVQVTISSREAIRNDAANWQDWAPGDVTADTNDGTDYPLTGARLIATTADADWEIRA